MTAIASFTSIRRILECVRADAALLLDLEQIIYPCLMLCFKADGLDSFDEGIACTTLLLYHGYKGDQPLSGEMWKLFKQIMDVCNGAEYNMEEDEQDFVYDYLDYVAVAIKNFMAKDPKGMMAALPDGEGQAYFHLTYPLIEKCLEINCGGNERLNCGVAVISIVIAAFENMHGEIDEEVPQLLRYLIDELNHQQTMSDASKTLTSELFQAISMAFAYNSELTLRWLVE